VNALVSSVTLDLAFSGSLFAVTKYAGIVGTEFFQNFNVIFDYKRKRINLEKIVSTQQNSGIKN